LKSGAGFFYNSGMEEKDRRRRRNNSLGTPFWWERGQLSRTNSEESPRAPDAWFVRWQERRGIAGLGRTRRFAYVFPSEAVDISGGEVLTNMPSSGKGRKERFVISSTGRPGEAVLEVVKPVGRGNRQRSRIFVLPAR